MYCQHDRDMHDIIIQGFIANECSALRPESENNHGPSQLKGSCSPGFWFPANYILSGTSYIHMYEGSSTIRNFMRKLTYHFYLRSIAETSAADFSREAHLPMEHIQASLKATGCRHPCAVSPRRLPWSMISNKTHKTLTKHNF
jgi:hypothetical protein